MKKTVKTTEAAGFVPRDREKYEFAERLYMQQVAQKEIAERVGVSVVTLTKWKERGQWEAKRAAKNISTDTLIAKAMARMNEMLDAGNDFNADAFSKVARQVKELQRGATVDDIINVLTDFGEWVIRQAATKKGVNRDFVQLLTTLQDEYMQAKLREVQQ